MKKTKTNRTTAPASPKRRGKGKKRNTRKYTFDLRSKRDRETGKKKGDEMEMDETRLDVRGKT